MLQSWFQLAVGGPSATSRPGTFLYDPATNKDLVTGTVVGNLFNGAVADGTVLIDGNPTMKFANASSGATITLPTPWVIETMPEWTVEWSSRPTTFGSGYFTELFIDVNPTLGYPLGCRWTDSGYGHRNQFNFANWANPEIWRPAATKTDVVNKTVRWAMVFKNGRVTVYKDGVKQMLAVSVDAGSGTQDYIQKTITWSNKTTLRIGYYNSTNQAFVGNFGRIRISDYARYTDATYTPQPF